MHTPNTVLYVINVRLSEFFFVVLRREAKKIVGILQNSIFNLKSIALSLQIDFRFFSSVCVFVYACARLKFIESNTLSLSHKHTTILSQLIILRGYLNAHF